MKGFLTAYRSTTAYCIFLPFGAFDSGSKFRRYQVFIMYHWTFAGMTKGNRLLKRKRNVLKRDDYFYFHHYFLKICITDKAWGGQYDWTFSQIPFFFLCILLDFLKVLYFFSLWLCHETSSFARSMRDLVQWISLRSLLRTYNRSTCSKSTILFTETKSAPMKKERSQHTQLAHLP